LVKAFGGFKITPLLDEPHVIAVGSRGYLYLGEVARAFGKVGRGARTIHKFERKERDNVVNCTLLALNSCLFCPPLNRSP
jgi:hypothetical protein